MKKAQLLIISIMMLTASIANAQVKGISYTLSPSIEYSDWSKTTGISDGYSIGGQLGFGFGQFVELRANYLQSINLQRDFSNFDLDNFADGLLEDQDIIVKRYGGELKVNLAKGGIVPFLTAGAGIQDVQRSMMSDSSFNRKNIYFSGGGGLQFSLGDRYTLALQAINTSFNDSPINNFLSEAEQIELGVDGVDFNNSELLKNWSYRASILLYLGGRRPGELTDTDKAYMENFTNGFTGLSLPIEVTAGQINFGDGLPYQDTKFTGLSSGFNFGQYVGIRAFYLRSMADGYFSEFNRLALYGGEGKFKLSDGQGLAPYLNVGGGVIDPLSGFEIDGVLSDEMENTPFVSGGLGLDIPFSRAFKLSGFAKALLTSNEESVDETLDPDKLTTSMMYGLSANFIIGSRSKAARQISNIELGSYDDMVAKSMKDEKGKADKIKKDYQQRIDRLDKEIDKAYEDGNMELMQKKYEERESAQRFVNRIEEIEKKEAKANGTTDANGMNPSEFRTMMEELQKSQEKSQQRINDRLDSIEESIDENNRSNRNLSRSDMTQRERELQNELDDLKKEAKKNRKNEDAGEEDMTEREKELQKEVEDLKKQVRKTANDVDIEMSDREKELQKEIEDLKKQARKTANDVDTEMSDREKELQKEVDELKRQSRKTSNEAKSEMSDREKELQDEIDKLKRQSRRASNEAKSEMSDREKELQKEIDELKRNNESAKSNENDVEEMKNVSSDEQLLSAVAGGGLSVSTGSSVNSQMVFLTESQLDYNSENLPDSSFFSRFNYDGASAIGGFNIGGNTTLNLGVRSHYRYRESNFYVMPEAFFGFGNPASFGLFANGVYQLRLKNENFSPYAGVGVGVLNIGDQLDNRTKLAANLVLGTYLFKVGGGRFYADLSARNFFKYNQLVAGYRLPF